MHRGGWIEHNDNFFGPIYPLGGGQDPKNAKSSGAYNSETIRHKVLIFETLLHDT